MHFTLFNQRVYVISNMFLHSQWTVPVFWFVCLFYFLPMFFSVYPSILYGKMYSHVIEALVSTPQCSICRQFYFIYLKSYLCQIFQEKILFWIGNRILYLLHFRQVEILLTHPNSNTRKAWNFSRNVLSQPYLVYSISSLSSVGEMNYFKLLYRIIIGEPLWMRHWTSGFHKPWS